MGESDNGRQLEVGISVVMYEDKMKQHEVLLR